MRVLWLCNIMLPLVAEQLHMEASNKEGWLTGLSETVLKRQADNGVELAVAFPCEHGLDGCHGVVHLQNGDRVQDVGIPESAQASAAADFAHAERASTAQGLRSKVSAPGKQATTLAYYGFCEDTSHPEHYDASLEERLLRILEDFQPDVVHCFGTEYPHTLAMTRAVKRISSNPPQLLIGIQGLCFKYADDYMADLPKYVQNRYLLRDFLKQDNLVKQQEKYVLRGEFEKEALKNTNHVTGRTDWDRDAVAEVNPDAAYHFMNETLRSNFYGSKWSLGSCERHSIFLSQGNYPIKGLHYLLQAMPAIVKEFPDTKVYVAGDVITRYGSLKEKLKIASYGKYCLALIKKNQLSDKIVFTGRLDAAGMCERFLKSHLFLSPSSIENSPNSVGEAMLLGMPVVSSKVGGVANMLIDKKEGLLYPHSDTDKLAEAVCAVFRDDVQAVMYGEHAREHALKTHDPETNYQRLIAIYREIAACTQRIE